MNVDLNPVTPLDVVSENPPNSKLSGQENSIEDSKSSRHLSNHKR